MRRITRGAALLVVAVVVPLLVLAALGARSRWARAARLRVAWLRRAWRSRVAVEGRSMAPGLEPGDWLLVDPDPWTRRPPQPGTLVVAEDPRHPERWLVKRIRAVQPDRRLWIEGDDASASTDSQTFGSVAPEGIRGRPVLRYWPPGRWGRVR